MIYYQHAELNQLDAAVAFALALNAKQENHSSYLSGRSDLVILDFQEAIANNRLFLALENDLIIGLLNTYPLPHLSRADTTILIKEGLPYEDIAHHLFRLARAENHPSSHYSFFFSIHNKRLKKYLLSINAYQEVTEYGLRYFIKNSEPLVDYQLIEEKDYEDWKRTFNEIFPSIYKTPEEILSQLRVKSQVLIYKTDHQIAGFCVLQINEKSSVIEMLGVVELYRRRGIARQMLKQVKCFLASLYDNKEVKLIVDTDNQNALKLYFDEGFEIEYENEHFIFQDGLSTGNFSDITIDDVREIANWKYQGYLENIIMTPYFQNYQQGNKLRGFEDSLAYSFYWNDSLFGLLELFEKKDGIEIGIAINPKYTNKSLSYLYLDEVVSFVKRIKRDQVRYLYIQADIEHHVGRHVYKKYGFAEVLKNENTILFSMDINQSIKKYQ